jgi:hypothetical protein
MVDDPQPLTALELFVAAALAAQRIAHPKLSPDDLASKAIDDAQAVLRELDVRTP